LSVEPVNLKQMSKNLRGLSARKGLTESLFSAIVKAGSDISGKKEIQLNELSDKYLVGKSSTLSTSSFYQFLSEGHTEKKVFMCNGTACLTSGKQEKLRQTLLAKFGEDEIGTVTCLGHCHSSNAFILDNTTCTFEDADNDSLIVKAGTGKGNVLFTGTNAKRPALLDEIADLKEYYGNLIKYAADIPGVLREFELSGLRGRGGAGFPLHIKLRTSSDTSSDKKYVVCNADEGDPGAFSDKWLLENRPHSILFGMIMAGLITGADTGVIYIRGEYPESVKAVKIAIDQFEHQMLHLKDPFNRRFNFTFHVMVGAGAYICGEETSLLNSIEGLRPEVRTRPPFPAIYGLFGKPTVLNNVETFANVSYILKEGGVAYSALGTERSTGTKLVSLDGAFHRPGVYEVRMGTPMEFVLKEMGGGTKYPVKAFQVGGPLGGIIPVSMISSLTLDFESFSSAGFLLGHAGIVSIPEGFPMVNFLLHLFEFTSQESCGKCFPCRLGSRRGYELLNEAVENKRKIDKVLFSDLLETMQLASLCALGGGISLPVLNSLKYFWTELKEYIE
jgi:NADH:ubiquinone oxidoreductase subunit F (NADH-binding)